MGEKINLSIIIPAYNEGKIIKFSLRKLISYLSNKKYYWELIVVDDGSNDSTSQIVKKFFKKNVRLVKLSHNRGKGAALREGMLNANGDIILYMDCDLSVPLENVDIFFDRLKNDTDIAIASRRLKDSKIEVHQSWLRENMGRVFTLLTRLITNIKISDFTCGFKGFRRNSAQSIFSISKIDRWAYDAEIMFIANKKGFRILELPVKWFNRKDTRVRLKNVILESFRDLIKIRINDILGKYE